MQKAVQAGGMRIGIDLGGTKIEGLAMSANGHDLARCRIATPRGDYAATIAAIRDLTLTLESEAGQPGSVGVAIPGSLSPITGRLQNGNSTWLNGQPFDRDLAEALGRPVRLANDANCFALSEAVDGAGQGARAVFGVILGTGCGGGIVVGGKLIDGLRGIGGEWGHNPLPWADAAEYPGQRCWCGRLGCMETWVSGPGMAADHTRVTGLKATSETIASQAYAGDARAQATLARHASRLARGLAHVVNIIDPDVIVLGGGLSKLEHLYTELPRLMPPHIFADLATVTIKPPRWGDAGGVRGAAWLWGGIGQSA